MKRIADLQKQLLAAYDMLAVGKFKKGEVLHLEMSGYSGERTKIQVTPEAFIRLIITLKVAAPKVTVKHDDDYLRGSFEARDFLWSTYVWCQRPAHKEAWEYLNNMSAGLITDKSTPLRIENSQKPLRLENKRRPLGLPAPEVIDV